MKIAFASDFDNTLYFSNKFPCIAQQDIDAITALRKAGGLFGISTGRPFSTLKYALEKCVDCDFYILSNGAEIKNGAEQSLQSTFTSKEAIRFLFEKYIAHAEESAIIAADTAFLQKKIPFTFSPFLHEDVTLSWEELPLDYLHGFSFYVNSPEKASEIYRDIKELSLKNITAFYNNKVVDIVPASCDKGKGILFIKEHFSIDAIAAMGDSFNDMPMLQAADISFTFSEAPEEVRNASSYTVKSIAEAILLFQQVCFPSEQKIRI